jgi:hypothetical protein
MHPLLLQQASSPAAQVGVLSSLTLSPTHMLHQCLPRGFWFVHISLALFHCTYSYDLVVGLFICFSLPHLHHHFFSCYLILKVGLFICFSLLLVASVDISVSSVLISWLGCSSVFFHFSMHAFPLLLLSFLVGFSYPSLPRFQLRVSCMCLCTSHMSHCYALTPLLSYCFVCSRVWVLLSRFPSSLLGFPACFVPLFLSLVFCYPFHGLTLPASSPHYTLTPFACSARGGMSWNQLVSHI